VVASESVFARPQPGSRRLESGAISGADGGENELRVTFRDIFGIEKHCASCGAGGDSHGA
jgi:hypothetical protein